MFILEINLLKLFEIKLYPYTVDIFEKKVDKKRTDFYDICKAQKRTKEESMRLYSHFYGGMNNLINYSIGYLEILYSSGCISYNVNLMLTERKSPKKDIEQMLIELQKEADLNEEERRQKEYAIKNSYSIEIYKPPLYTGKKHYMQQYRNIFGMHTYVGDCSNLEIVEKIKEDIEDIQKDKFFKNIYFDLSIFNTLVNYIDFNGLFENEDIYERFNQ